MADRQKDEEGGGQLRENDIDWDAADAALEQMMQEREREKQNKNKGESSKRNDTLKR